MMKSQPADEQTHTNQILRQHKYKHNKKLGNEFSLDEKEIMRNGKRGRKESRLEKCKHIILLPLDKHWAM
jgi:hypothetical protein